jgi:superfamily II DNA or RNA helicase
MANRTDDQIFYPDYDSSNFGDIIDKYEFSSNSAGDKKSFIYQEPNQMLMRNFISKYTIYENVLLYNQLGTGKTCTSIAIAEGFKEYVNNMGKRIVVLVKNKNIQRNFMNELLSKCTNDDYLNDKQRDFYFGVNVPKTPQAQVKRTELVNKVHRFVNKSYSFLTYGTFVNRVLGARDFDLDPQGQKTKVKRVNGQIKRKPPKDVIRNLNNTVVIIDEAHNITNNDVYLALHQVLSRSFNFRVVLLTATPMSDNPKEMFELANLLNVNNPEAQLPIRNDLFRQSGETDDILVEKRQSRLINNRVLKGGVVTVTQKGMNVLSKVLHGKVSYLRANTDTNPKKNDKGKPLIKNRKGTTNVVYCAMSQFQYHTYLKALKLDVKDYSRYDLSAIQNIEAEENIQESTSVSKTSSLYKNSSDASTMAYPEKMFGKEGFTKIFEKASSGFRIKKEFSEVLTSKLGTYSTKLYKLLQNINNSQGNVFIYTNYVSFGGTSLVKQVLIENGYKDYRGKGDGNDYKSFFVFDESMNAETREKYRRIFNSPENKDGKLIKIIVGSPIIAEGITLKNVRQVHILEPSWNMSRINQIIGRAVRNYSHHDLAEEDRNVDIFKYVSVYVHPKSEDYKPRSSLETFFIDREKYILSEEKDRSNKRVERLLKEVSLDCEFMKLRNTMTSDAEEGTAYCDYQKCNFTCAIPSTKFGAIDKSTYNLYIEFFEKHDIYYIIALLRDMFKSYFVWNLDDIVSKVQEIEPLISRESIYSALGYVVENKTSFTDMYNRDGFILQKGQYYIFNDFDIDINSSLYSKILDFSVDKNKYNLQQFVVEKLNINMFDEDFDESGDKKKKEKVETDDTPLSNMDIKYNEQIIAKHQLFGTYRQRGTKEQQYGPKDDKFRIVDLRNSIDDEDKRKTISGMWIGSFKKPKLIEIAKYLKLKTNIKLEDHDKDQLGKLIETHMMTQKMVLK